MGIDIENPGDDAAALSAAMGNLVGWTHISAHQVTTDEGSVTIELPDGYDMFQLVARVIRDTGGSVCFAFSFDDGATFVCDTDNLNSYRSGYVGFQGGTTVADQFEDSVGYLNPIAAASDTPCGLDAMIYPGEAGSSTVIRCDSTGDIQDHSQVMGCSGAIRCNTVGRPTHIRLTPEYGNGDIDPPTATSKFTSGVFHLFGAPV